MDKEVVEGTKSKVRGTRIKGEGYFTAMQEISTLTSLGRRLTSTVSLAGDESIKYRP